MFSLLRLPFILLEMALRGAIRRLVAGDDDRPYVPTAEAEAEAAASARARREAERVAAAEAAARRPAARPSAARRRTRPERPVASVPDPGPEAELLGDAPAHVSRDAEPVASFGPADDPQAALRVQAPWPGYDDQTAAEVVQRVRQGDDATRAVVLLYERVHKGRKSVIAAAEATSS